MKRITKHKITEYVESISHRADFGQAPNLSTFDAVLKVKQFRRNLYLKVLRQCTLYDLDLPNI